MKSGGAHPPPGTRIDLDELPRHSPWPARLLQAREGVLRQKDRGNVLREFNDEKWNSLLSTLARADSPDLQLLQDLIAPPDDQRVYLADGALYLAPARQIQAMYQECLQDHLERHGKQDCIGELGGGAGNLLLHLAKFTNLASRWVSYELTKNGRSITQSVAARERLNVSASFIDFDTIDLPHDATLAKGGLYYSSFSLAYCREPYAFLSALIEQAPAAIVLLEPVYQFFEEDRLLGLLAKRYFEYNDYSVGLWPALQRLESETRVEIVRVDRNFFGHNPLCPVTAIHLKVGSY